MRECKVRQYPRAWGARLPDVATRREEKGRRIRSRARARCERALTEANYRVANIQSPMPGPSRQILHRSTERAREARETGETTSTATERVKRNTEQAPLARFPMNEGSGCALLSKSGLESIRGVRPRASACPSPDRAEIWFLTRRISVFCWRSTKKRRR